MSKYDLARLTDYDFELLCKSILEADSGMRFEAFSRGKDGGIDLRCQPDNNTLIVVQCKHWIHTNRSTLIRHLKKDELPKVKKLNPSRYIVMTSTKLNPDAKAKIQQDFSGYIETPGDIWGIDDIAAYLDNHPDLVKKHPRLWLTNTTMLEVIVNKDIYTESQIVLNDLPDALLRFAAGSSVEEAEQVLQRQHVCVISGVPGIGKTVLAKYLLSRLVEEGYQLISLENVRDGLKVAADEEKQVFFYDDFLGQSELGDNLNNGRDASLLNLIKYVGNLPNKRFILTTREYILAQARSKSEKLRHNEQKLGKFILDLAKFTYPIRAQILYNHLYFSRIQKEFVAPFAESDIYEPIVNHRNFSPRIIEAAINSASESSTPVEQRNLPDLLLKSLDDPMHIWESMYDNQIDNSHRDLLSVLYLAGGDIEWQSALDEWSSYRGVDPNRDSVEFQKRVKDIDGTLVTTNKNWKGQIFLDFYNPSVRDYLTHKLIKHPPMMRELVPRVTRTRTVESFWLFNDRSSSDGLWSSLRIAIPILDERLSVFLQREALELKDMTDGWGSKIARLLEIADTLDSQILWPALADVIEKHRPEYQEDWSDYTVLIEAVRVCRFKKIHNFEAALIDWAIKDISDTVSFNGWETLKSAAETLSEIGGERAEEELAALEEKMDSFAIKAAENMLDPERRTYDYADSKDFLERLEAYSDAAETFAGFEELQNHVSRLENAQEDNWGYVPVDRSHRENDDVALMMASLTNISAE